MNFRTAKAKDVMHRRVFCVRQDMLVGELARIFDDKHISGAPVVDGSRRVVGVVSKTDLVHFQRSNDGKRASLDYYQFPEAEGLPKGFHVETPDRSRVRDIMTPHVVSAEDSTPVSRLAGTMLGKKIHRILITRGGRLKGIVTAMDLLKVFAK